MFGDPPKVEIERWRKRQRRLAPYYLIHEVPWGSASRYLLAFSARGAARATWLRAPDMVHMAMAPVAAQRSPDPRDVWRAPAWAWHQVEEDALWGALGVLIRGGVPDLPILDVASLPMQGRDWTIYPAEVTHG